jgi:Asp/Glu/Hydantoin racemase
MIERIVVINPNSTQAVTDAIDVALQPWRMAGGPAIECVTLAEGPPGIETQAHVEQVVPPICGLVRACDDAAAFVIACFSDPGLHAAREATPRPVLGIAECGLLTALTHGERFGIVAILPTSLPRHLRYVRELGLTTRFAGDLPLGLGEAGLAFRGVALAPFAHGLGIDPGRGGDRGARPAISQALDYQASTVRRGSGILMDVHPGLRAAGWRRSNHSLPARTRVDNLHSNDN